MHVKKLSIQNLIECSFYWNQVSTILNIYALKDAKRSFDSLLIDRYYVLIREKGKGSRLSWRLK